MADDRRTFQRLNLTKAIEGRFGDRAVRIADVSASGAQLIVDAPMESGTRARLQFSWRAEEVDVIAEVTRSDDGHAGVRFVEANDALRNLLAASVLEILHAQEANAGGDRARNVIGDDATLTAASERELTDAFLSFRLGDGGWKRRRSLLPDQPDDGFTIRAGVPQEDVDLLCRTYEGGDAESRRLTRLMAELSVSR
ncbi:MAG: PilZ domain-containing protein [Acidobacteriota bacterium]